MITRFDIGEKVYIEAEVDRISISAKGITFYDIRLPEGCLIRVDEDKLYKTPANDVEMEMPRRRQ